jgi:hypothetical protein
MDLEPTPRRVEENATSASQILPIFRYRYNAKVNTPLPPHPYTGSSPLEVPVRAGELAIIFAVLVPVLIALQYHNTRHKDCCQELNMKALSLELQ